MFSQGGSRPKRVRAGGGPDQSQLSLTPTSRSEDLQPEHMFSLEIFHKSPGETFASREVDIDTLIKNNKFSPSEGHCSAHYFIGDTMYTIHLGGIFPEDWSRSAQNDRIYITSYTTFKVQSQTFIRK